MNSPEPQKTQGDCPQVSVIIAAHNAASFLGKAIDSALQQADVTLEVLVADDASDDSTRTVLDGLARADSRIVPIHSPTNLGPAGARNLALDRARGTWIAVLDSDDLFRADRLSDMIRTAQSTGADIVIDDFASVDEQGTQLDQSSLVHRHGAGDLTLADWIYLNSFSRGEVSFGYAKPLLSRAFLRDTGLRYNETLRNGEDFHLILEALVAGATLHFTAQTGYLYTRRAGSVSRRAKLDHLRALLVSDQQVASKVQDPDVLALFKQRQKNLTSLLVTEDVLGRLKTGHPVQAMAGMIRHPAAFGRILGHLGEAVQKRLTRSR